MGRGVRGVVKGITEKSEKGKEKGNGGIRRGERERMKEIGGMG